MADFSGKVVVVTGAGSGIGFALCQTFANAGAYVALNDLDGPLAEDAAARINMAVGEDRVLPYVVDVADVRGIQAMIDDMAEQHGRLDIVIANAGLSIFGRFLDYTPEQFDRLTAVNIRGTFFTVQAAARQMIARNTKDGRILLVSSTVGKTAFLGLGPYGVTKAAIIHMARTLAIEVGEYDITVNTITPGAILTERNLVNDPVYDANWASVTPTGRVGYVEDIAATAMFLSSPEARQITGQNIIVDGGWTLQNISPSSYLAGLPKHHQETI
jgi:NAD(P)-dependent dehydrogenase (short-subunit alcohol dehydrogenase family)